MKKSYIFVPFLMICLLAFPAIAQQQISGKVTSAEDGLPLPGVSILLQGTKTGAVTDIDGNYSIGVPGPNAVLIFSFIGYQDKNVPVGNNSTLDVTLLVETSQLDEVIVTAFGISQEKKSLGYSAQNINADEIIKSKQPNVVNALQGQVAGVQVTNSGGAPGQSARIIIRGINSLDRKS